MRISLSAERSLIDCLEQTRSPAARLEISSTLLLASQSSLVGNYNNLLIIISSLIDFSPAEFRERRIKNNNKSSFRSIPIIDHKSCNILKYFDEVLTLKMMEASV